MICQVKQFLLKYEFAVAIEKLIWHLKPCLFFELRLFLTILFFEFIDAETTEFFVCLFVC